MSKASDTVDHAKAKVQRRDDTVGLQRPEGKLCHEESTMKCMAWSRSLEWNTDPIETAEVEDLIGQTSQCMYSCEEHHAHELAEAHRWTSDETHDLSIGCQARGGCKRLCWSTERLTCRANLRLTTRLSNRGSQWRGVEIHSYSHTSR